MVIAGIMYFAGSQAEGYDPLSYFYMHGKNKDGNK